MIRPGVTLALWLAFAVLVIVNNMIGDTWIAARLPVIAVQWYKVLVPLPYLALLAALLWPPSTVLADFLYERITFGEDPSAFLSRFAFWWGAPYLLLVIALFAAPLVAGRLVAAR